MKQILAEGLGREDCHVNMAICVTVSWMEERKRRGEVQLTVPTPTTANTGSSWLRPYG